MVEYNLALNYILLQAFFGDRFIAGATMRARASEDRGTVPVALTIHWPRTEVRGYKHVTSPGFRSNNQGECSGLILHASPLSQLFHSHRLTSQLLNFLLPNFLLPSIKETLVLHTEVLLRDSDPDIHTHSRPVPHFDMTILHNGIG